MLTPEQYVAQQTHQYPTLYATGNYAQSETRVMNQFLNVIGNGIRDGNEMREELESRFDDTVNYSRYWLGQPLFIGYTKLNERMSRICGEPHGDFDSAIPGAYLETERDQPANLFGVVHWENLASDIEKNKQWKPYPNFKKEYSTVWFDDFEQLGAAWVEAAQRFYAKCVEYFQEDCATYHYAYPCATQVETLNRDADLARYLEPYESNEAISEAYGTPYNGNIQEFQRARWNIERDRIMTFLAETQTHLSEMHQRLTATTHIAP